MPRSEQEADAALRKLGQRLRAGNKRRTISNRSLDTIKSAVREAWEQERTAIPHDAITGNMTLEGLASRYRT